MTRPARARARGLSPFSARAHARGAGMGTADGKAVVGRNAPRARNDEKERAARFFGSNRICGLVLHHRPSSRSRGMRLLLLLRVVSTLPLAMTRRS